MLSKKEWSSYKGFFSIVVVMFATVFSPPFIRMLGSRAWIGLGISEGYWSNIMAGRGLFFVIFILAAGVLGDLHGRRRMLLLTLAGFIFCIPILIFTNPFSSEFFITYVLWAIFGVMIRTLALTFLLLQYEGRERILALVVYSILSGAAFLLSPLLARLLNDQLGFNATFIAPLLLALAGFFLVQKTISESRASADFWRLDAVALAVWTFGLCLMIFAGVLSGGLGWVHPLVLGSFWTGAALILAVYWLSDRPRSKKWQIPAAV